MSFKVDWQYGTDKMEVLQPAGLGPFNITEEECIIEVDTTLSAPVGSIYTLPAITPANKGQIFFIKKVIDTSLAQVIVNPAGADTVDNGAPGSLGLITVNDAYMIASDGVSNWMILANYA
jgi:hypothetical protein